MSSVSGGKGSPRFGCRRSWQEGLSACTNRLTIRIKVAEPQILARLQAQLLEPKTLAYITKALEREAKKALSTAPRKGDQAAKTLDQERRKLQNLVSALEDGSAAPASILKAIEEREKAIVQLERQVEASRFERPKPQDVDLGPWAKEQLSDLSALLRTDVHRVKAEFRRLNLGLAFTPVESEPRAHYVVEGQCDLRALVFSFVRPRNRRQSGAAARLGAVLDLLRGQSAV